MASSKTATGDKKKKEPPSSSSGAKKTKSKDKTSDRAASKDTKDKRSKKPSSSSSSAKTKSTPALPTREAALPATPISHDPDAVQLFRRYDRARAGALTRLDFLQLLRDYANPPTAAEHSSPRTSASHGQVASNAHRASGRPHMRKPLSLTDTSGIPLGYERSDKNSEFEAGQLFERYDRDRTGALTLDKFHTFFVDFRPQLTAFVEDLNYFGISPPQHHASAAPAAVAPAPAPLSSPAPYHDTSSSTKDIASSKRPESAPETSQTSRLAEYQTALWKLRKLCKHELLDQRERILDTVRCHRIARCTLERGAA